MAMRLLSAGLSSEEARYRPYINTGGPLDIITGKFMPSTTGTWILSGGMGSSTAVIAEANKFKSTLLNGSLINGLARFPDTQFFLNDTESSTVDKQRLASMSTLYLDEPEKRAAHIEDLKTRISIYDPSSNQAESLEAWFDFMKQIRDEKVTHHKDYEVETEILDPDTMKPHRMMLPTFMSIDSWTEAAVRQVNVKNDSFDADTEMKEQRTIHMEEGWQKSRLMRQLQPICARAGIYLGLSGHLGKKIAMGTSPNKKDMQHMGQDEAVKSMSNKFYFLMAAIIKINNTKALTDKNDNRESDYPSDEHIAGSELQRLMITLVRSKNINSGSQTTMVSSQRFGIMNALSYYDYLRENKYYGMGTANKVRSPLLGDLNIGRTKIFDQSKDYKVGRALELTYQLFMIQSTWTLMGQPVDYSIPIEQFAEKLATSSYATDDILNSRGWWTYKGAKVERDLLTLPDIMMIINGTYKPKFLSANGK
jgi:hypothetical protein